jgi:5-methylcytosine-specific restriction enzyme B
MGKLFLGKISGKNPEQFERDFYAAGPAPQGNNDTYYGALRPGDFAFPIHKGRVSKLWKMLEFTKDFPNRINPNGVARFAVERDYGEGFSVSADFLRYKYFDLDLNLLNKSVKSAELGFFAISTLPGCPDPREIDLSNKRKIVIEADSSNLGVEYADFDIRVQVGAASDLSILDIEMMRDGRFAHYESLWRLYMEKNPGTVRPSIRELLALARQDQAKKKEGYIQAVLADLEEKGFFIVGSPVALYDDILVGRKRSRPRSPQTHQEPEPTGVSDEPAPDENENEDELESFSIYSELLDQNPNLILYGPPGTGKTYAVSRIIESVERKHTGAKKSFEEIKSEGRVEFVTFHQSFTYEEFVEGIKPIMVDTTEGDSKSAGFGYRPYDGIVKRLADRANLCQLKDKTRSIDLSGLDTGSSVFKISLGKRRQDQSIYDDCRAASEIAIGWLEEEDLSDLDYDSIYAFLAAEAGREGKPTNDASSVDCFVNSMKPGDIVFVYDGPETIRDIVLITGEYRHDTTKEYPHRRSVRWLKHFDPPLNILSMNGSTALTMKTVYKLNRIQFSDIREILRDDPSGAGSSNEKTNAQICFLVIDEINRGNISKIFGELITLIEKDKRDTLDITLPYSRKPFHLPWNIYIIGTMNTADRSIAVLDTALRRRFFFMEIEPDPGIIERSDNPTIDDAIDLPKLLDALNVRILEKFDRDHRIGHAYFLDLFNMRQLELTWYFKILPLLMEYFYNDGKSIARIVGEEFIDPKTCSPKRLKGDDFIGAVRRIYER